VLKGRKRRKWEGLSKTEETLSLELKVAEGPVVAMLVVVFVFMV